jgi:hypothetical protein
MATHDHPEKSAHQITKLSLRRLNDLRMAIKAGQIVTRLNGFVLGAVETATDTDGTVIERPIDMNTNQVRAALGLLNKVLPDLQSIAMQVEAPTVGDLSTDEVRRRFRAIMAEAAADVHAIEPPVLDSTALLTIEEPPDLLALE